MSKKCINIYSEIQISKKHNIRSKEAYAYVPEPGYVQLEYSIYTDRSTHNFYIEDYYIEDYTQLDNTYISSSDEMKLFCLSLQLIDVVSIALTGRKASVCRISTKAEGPAINLLILKLYVQVFTNAFQFTMTKIVIKIKYTCCV